MTESKDQTDKQEESIVLLPCPFCGANNWTQQTVHSTARILTHRQGCWIGRSEQNQETWINPGCDFFAQWNKRAKQKCVCDALEEYGNSVGQ